MKIAPTVAPAGWVVNASALAAAGLTAIGPLVTVVTPLALKSIVMLVATLCERLANVTMPSVGATLVVPCKLPLPVPLERDALTTVPLSGLPLAALRKLPNWSCTWSTGCWANATPAVAVAEGCV